MCGKSTEIYKGRVRNLKKKKKHIREFRANPPRHVDYPQEMFSGGEPLLLVST